MYQRGDGGRFAAAAGERNVARRWCGLDAAVSELRRLLVAIDEWHSGMQAAGWPESARSPLGIHPITLGILRRLAEGSTATGFQNKSGFRCGSRVGKSGLVLLFPDSPAAGGFTGRTGRSRTQWFLKKLSLNKWCEADFRPAAKKEGTTF